MTEQIENEGLMGGASPSEIAEHLRQFWFNSRIFTFFNHQLLTLRQMIIYFVFIYVFFLFLTTVVDHFAFKMVCLFCLGICNSMANMSTMTLVSESVSSKKRSLFSGIINVGYICCPIMYTPLNVILGKWRYIYCFKI